MFRRWLSEFYRNNKQKIKTLAKLFGVLLLIGICAMGIFGTTGNKTNNDEKKNPEVYTPSKTIISGYDISEEKFEKDQNLVDLFIEYCNSQNYKEAYNLLTDECKEKLYSTQEKFEKNYCSLIFNRKKRI